MKMVKAYDSIPVYSYDAMYLPCPMRGDYVGYYPVGMLAKLISAASDWSETLIQSGPDETADALSVLLSICEEYDVDITECEDYDEAYNNFMAYVADGYNAAIWSAKSKEAHQ